MTIQDLKRINAILFFAYKEVDKKIDRLKLVKLLWLADRIHLNRFGRTILRDKLYALPHGPIPSRTMDLSEKSIDDIFRVENYVIEAEDRFDPKYFSKTDLDTLEEVWSVFGDRNEMTLRDYSHIYEEWKRYESQLKDPKQPDRYPIIMEDLFLAPPEGECSYYNAEQSKMAKEKYEHYNNVQALLK